MAIWNPWHGCKKYSPGCANCYVYRRDESIGKDASLVTKTGNYDMPLKKNRQGEYKLTKGDGWDHVTICSTCENQDRADYRIPILLELPIKHRRVASEPMLEEIHIEKYLSTGLIEHVVCGGESGPKARPCNYDWILEVRRECIENNVPFTFKQTGAVFIKDGKTYHIERKNQMSQARKAGIDFKC